MFRIESAFNDENQLEFEELVEEIAELTDWEGFKIGNNNLDS